MHRFFLMLLLIALFAATPWAQDGEESTADEIETTEPADEIEATEEVVVDDEYYQDVDDKDFRPSEDIPADQSIPFPTDI